MDDPTVEWSQARYKECSEKLATFLKSVGYGKADVTVGSFRSFCCPSPFLFVADLVSEELEKSRGLET